jgi:carbamoyltransferase
VGKILEDSPFKEVYVQPASHDGGTSLGAAYYVYHKVLNNPRKFVMEDVYFGPEFNAPQKEGKFFENKEELTKFIAKKLVEKKIVGWFQGKMEWGPRALGNRSILVDPRDARMKDILNKRIKHREPFRPFAPSILEEKVGEYFHAPCLSPFMTMNFKVKEEKRKLIPAVVHVDGTSRLQTVSKKTNPLYWLLIKEFEKLTGVPVLLNTSFNENEPIVCTPEEALDCFFRTKMDVLVINNYVLEK